MASKAVRDAVYTAVSAAWTYTSVVKPNEAFSPPADGSSCLYLAFPMATETMISIGAPGNNVFREEGAFRCVLELPIGEGTDPWATRIDTLRAALRCVSLGGQIRTYEASPPIENGMNDNGNYYEISFAVSYRNDVFG